MNKASGMKLLAITTVLFGLLTIFSGGRALFGDAQAQAAAGNVVPFVLWFNFVAGFAYIAAGAGLWMKGSWVQRLTWAIALGTAIVSVAFAIVVIRGIPYEVRTAGALVLRLAYWTAVAIALHRSTRINSGATR